MVDSIIIGGLFAVFCLIGYILGQLKSSDKSTPIIIHTEPREKKVSKQTPRQRTSRKSTQVQKNRRTIFEEENPVAKISIDDRIIVTGTETAGIEKKFGELGKTTESADNISSSVNKLKNLKG